VKNTILILSLLLSVGGQAQEIGYLSGANRIGISPSRFQPLYGFTVGAQINKTFAIETALFYSQRSYGETIQADYLSFMALFKIGHFGSKAGVYYAPGMALNPTLYHSNIENHTYISHVQSVGGQVNLSPKIIIDLKLAYDFGLSGAYYDASGFKKYSGFMVLAGLKFKLNNK
jgi:hypothetical protein